MAGDVMSFKLGCNESKVDPRNLLFAEYAAKLPAPPAAVDYYSKVLSWPMMLNNVLGDCVAAAPGHAVQQWTAYAGKPFIPTDAEIQAFYEFSGYNPANPGSDQGWDILSMAKYFRQNGIGGHKIAAFVQLANGNWEQLQQSIALFGNGIIGLQLPDWTVPQDGTDWTTIPWTSAGGPLTPNPANGHCVLVPGYNGVNGRPVSWGTLMPDMDAAFYKACNMQSVAFVSQDWIEQDGKSPSGFAVAQLLIDLKEVTA
jgi:hypothetical protein